MGIRSTRREPALWLFVSLVGVAVLMRLNNGIRYPALHGFDAYGHVTYIWHILRTGTVPLASEGWGRFHPPLYYWICAGIWSLLRAIDPREVLKVIGVTFGLASLGSAWVSYALARGYFRDERVAAYLASLFVLFLPVQIYIAPMLGNEVFNTVLCSLALYFMVRTLQTETLGTTIALGVTLGLALLTKTTAIAYVPAAGLVIVAWGLHTGRWRAAFTRLVVIGVLTLTIAGWFYARNVAVYGSPFQMSRDYFVTHRIEATIAKGQRGIAAYTTLDSRIFTDPTYHQGPVLDSVWTGAYATTWFDAHGGWFLPPPPSSLAIRRIGRALMVLGTIPTLLVLLGLVTCVWRLFHRGWDDTLVVMFVALGMMAALFVAYTFNNRIYTAVKASYMLPAIVPFGFFFALGVSTVGTWGRARAAVLAELLLLVMVIIPVYTYELFFEVELGPHYWNTIGVVDYFAGFRDLARAKFDTAREFDLYLAHENAGSIALEEGNVHQALFETREAMRLLPAQVWGRPEDVATFIRLTRAEYSNSLAVIYDRLGWDDLAQRSAQQAATLDPSLPEAHYDLAVLMIERGMPEVAINSLRQAIALDPGFAEAHLLLGVAEQRAGNCTAALATLEHATAVRRWPRRTYPHAVGTGDFHDAAIVRRRHITHLPPSVNVDYALAVCRATANEGERAGRDLAKALASGRLPAGALRDRAWRTAGGTALVSKVLPNILVVMIDTLRADHVGAYGYSRPTTPELDELAAGGVRFANAFSVSSWTGPAVASLFTGVMPSRHGIVDSQSRLDAHVHTLAEELGGLGYDTAGFSANFVHVSDRTRLNRGFRRFEVLRRETTSDEYTFAVGEHHFRGYDARELTETVQHWMNAGPPQPFFLYVHYLDPHSGYQPPEAMRLLFETAPYTGTQGATAADIGQLERSGKVLAQADLEHLIALYDGEIRFTDEQIAELLRGFERSGFRDNSVIVIVADHGEEFQDHGHFFHGFTLYDEVIRVPMILVTRGTWSFAPRVVRQLVQLTDLFPTLIEMAGGVAPADIDGRSILPLLRGDDEPVREAVVAELAADPVLDVLMHPKRHRLAVVDRSRKAIVGVDGGTQLYRTDSDPGERRDVAAAEGSEVGRLLRFAAIRPAVATEATPPVSEMRREQLRALGYVP
jgi:arylsulfatase A-like enzyme/tetratricopeptide (TPR) repeat protein